VIKDNIATRDLPTTAGSRLLEGYRAPGDATAVERARRGGAVVVAKANLDEFGMGSSNENSGFGPVKNPWDAERVPGGSSGGSAAAVAAGLAPLALGTDTGGSVRQPAAFCGVVGVKPTYGRVSRSGLVAFASSLDTIGPISRDVAGAAAVLSVIAGRDPLDATSSERGVDDYARAAQESVPGVRVGLPEEYLGDGLEEPVRQAVLDAARALEDAGASVTRVGMPHTGYGVAAYHVLADAEASSNLARYDGIRYGAAPADARDEDDLVVRTRTEGFGEEVKRRIVLGTFALSAGYRDRYYLTAQRVRSLIAADFDAAFSACEVLLTPVTPGTAFRLGERADDPLSMYLSDVFTAPTSLAGVPAASVPWSVAGDGLPVGVQLVAPRFDEAVLFRAAAALERVAPFRDASPALGSDEGSRDGGST
ncbi:MAG: Asp-tRNA(Asn)/Glu-tRNA(Gln) amidotransferase subunit GatA, partial [Candidatus Eisenbacteria bacterium]|nr:Asp-tRNA(Asn)/Glu-tRNA(Gln) amidotransferase subunit GatA [Candidatus Eisenbacteria bacterium]